MRIPIWSNGKPTNLQAAIIDAEYWLRWLRCQINDPTLTRCSIKQTERGLRQAIQALEKFLPPDEEPSLDDPFDKAQDVPSEELDKVVLTPAQQAKFNLIKAKLRARQEKMRESG